jgi:excinuclease ABC subunit C
MEMSRLKEKIPQLPQEPGVYFFYGAVESAYGGRPKKIPILYIGKATDLRSRVQSYFRTDSNLRMDANLRIKNERGPWIERMVGQVADIDFLQTDSVLEALILEANLIKKYLPKYNTMGKDDKSAAYFAITKEEFPKILILRKTDIDFENLKTKNYKLKTIFGPYASKHQMQIALKIIRRIFPFHSGKQKTEKGCLDFQLGLCPGPYAGAISRDDYEKNIRGIRLILEGKKKSLVTALEKEMQAAAKKNEFEKAAQLRNRIFALNHIRDVSLITRDDENFQIPNSKSQTNSNDQISKSKNLRIEAYDVSNISGQYATGSMVVFENNLPNKKEYRKFKIKTVVGSDDVGMMREVLSRRFRNDWPMPDLILLDGGQGHLNMAEKLLHEELGLAVDIAAVAKGQTRKNLKFKISNLKLNQEIQNVLKDKFLVKRIMDEAHRFAIVYHRKLRGKSTLQ